MTQSEQFAQALEAKFGQNFRNVALKASDLTSCEGSQKPTCWDGHGDIEVVTFSDGSTYEPTEDHFCKSAATA